MTSHNRRANVAGLHVALVVAWMSSQSCGHGSPAAPTPSAAPPPSPPAQTVTLSGTVSETAPTESTHLAGARVTVYDSPDIGRSTITDANGAFQITGLRPGTLALSIQAAGFDEGKQAVALTENQVVAIQLDPVFQIVTTDRSDAISGDDTCPGYWDYATVQATPASGSHPCQVDYVLNVHHRGTFTAELTWTDRDAVPSIELYRSSGGQASGNGILLPGDSTHVSGGLDAHAQYIVRVRKFSNGGGPPAAGISPFTLRLTHPN